MDYVTKPNATVNATQFQMYRLIPGVNKFCSNYIVRSPLGIQHLRSNDYVIRLDNGQYFGIPKEVFELLMEVKASNG